MKRKGLRRYGMEGDRGAPWILEDFGDFVLRIFRENYRKFYDLETLWCDAPLVKWEKAKRPRKPAPTGTEG